MKLKVLVLLLATIVCSPSLYSKIFYVTNPGGNGWWIPGEPDGTFLKILEETAEREGRDTIKFDVICGCFKISL